MAVGEVEVEPDEILVARGLARELAERVTEFANRALRVKELKEAASSLKEAADTLRGAKKKKKGGFGRKLLILAVGAGVALALSEGLRKKVLDTLFGAEEEFEYTSTTTPSSTGTPVGTT